ncbi:MAG: translocation/assembly module TamB domain-containing protein [Gallionella sp.]|nr:translocation/assembly module TamB domain-containing protein [Gallionella sp.]
MARVRNFLGRFSRRLRLLAVLTIALFGALFAALPGWLLFTESGLTWTVATLERNSGGQVRIEGARGRLAGPLTLERLHVVSGTDRYTFHGLELAWNPISLLGGLLEIHALKVARVELLWPEDAPPIALPASLRLPLAARLDALEIGILEMHDAPHPFARELKAALSGDGAAYRLDAFSVVIDAGTLTGQGTLAAAAPFELRAEAKLAGSGASALQVAARAGGTLEAIALDFDGQGQGFSIAGQDFSITGQAKLRPFAAHLLAALRMTARDFDPRAFVAAAPHARLALDVDLAPQADGALAGHLRADNAAPLPLDRGGLPFSRAETSLVLHWDTGPRRLRLDDLVLKIGAGGTAGGRVDLVWPDAAPWPQGDADLKVAQLDPSALHSALRPMRLAGRILMSGDADAQRATLALADGARHLDAELARRGDTLTLSRLLLAQGAAELAGAGELRLDTEQAWQFAGTLRHFDPSAFVEISRADLNAEFEGSGRLAPQFDGRLRFALGKSSLPGQILAGDGDLSFAGLDRPDELLAANGKAHLRGTLNIRLGNSSLHAKGGWGDPAEKLALSVKMPDLTHLRALVPGALVPGLPADLSGALDLSVEGTPMQHRLRVNADLPGGRATHLTATGALHAPSPNWRDLAWQGKVETLSLSGDFPLALIAPAQLMASRARITLGAAELAFAGGRIVPAEIDWQPGRWSSRGRYTGIALRPGDEALSGLEPLRIGGEWSLSGATHIEGWLRANRESGDWMLPGILPPAMRAAGLETLRLEAHSAGGRVSLDVVAAGSRIGHWQAGATLPLAGGAAGFVIPPSPAAGEEPLTGWLKAAITDLAWVGPALDGNLTSAGALDIDAELSGTLDAPLLSGHVRGGGLAVGLIDQNIQLRDGELAIRFDQQRAVLERLAFIAPQQPPPRAARTAGFTSQVEPGRLNIEGELDLRQRGASLTATLTRLPLSQRPERWVVASGKARLNYGADRQRDRLKIGAELVADAGFIAEAASSRPELSEDIVVLGQLPVERRGPRIESDISFDLGEHFHLRSTGLAARLTGRLRVRGDGDGPLVATGSIATRDATFDAYGQRLAVERGIVNFQGALDDPGLNVLALRKDLAVEAGVSVTGTAQRPVVRLVSTPPVPDAEKLSWIVLGRPPDAGGTDTSLLLSAAGAILGGQGEGLTAQLAQAFGIDEISLRQAPTGDPLTGQILTLGKRLSARTYIGYEQGLTAAAGAIKLTHALTPRISIITRSGEDNAIDVFYHFAFD